MRLKLLISFFYVGFAFGNPQSDLLTAQQAYQANLKALEVATNKQIDAINNLKRDEASFNKAQNRLNNSKKNLQHAETTLAKLKIDVVSSKQNLDKAWNTLNKTK